MYVTGAVFGVIGPFKKRCGCIVNVGNLNRSSASVTPWLPNAQQGEQKHERKKQIENSSHLHSSVKPFVVNGAVGAVGDTILNNKLHNPNFRFS